MSAIAADCWIGSVGLQEDPQKINVTKWKSFIFNQASPWPCFPPVKSCFESPVCFHL